MYDKKKQSARHSLPNKSKRAARMTHGFVVSRAGRAACITRRNLRYAAHMLEYTLHAPKAILAPLILVALAYIAQLEKAHVFSGPVVTRVEQFKGFYPAENYHQNYLALHPDDPYIFINDRPKINELKRMFPDLYRNDPVLLKTAA
jgi:Peptide methionine sulfoxide reductase